MMGTNNNGQRMVAKELEAKSNSEEGKKVSDNKLLKYKKFEETSDGL